MVRRSILISLFGLLVTVFSVRAVCDAPTTFTLANNSSGPVGVVTITLADSSTETLTIQGQGTYAIQLEGPVASITINSQTVVYPHDKLIVLTDGTKAHIRWASPLIVIVDQNEM